MLLKALEMQGFKSFPDKTVLRLGKGITSVVGPNGSGKSNISDGVRWVLGEQSTKNLRGSKMEDVVFSGTDTRKGLGFAEVTLRLDNEDRTIKGCDRDEVSVTRRYFRSGESEYILNGESVRLKDIHELFMDTGLGRDGYSLVSQGRVAELISARSIQRREMLEEAAGISHFRYRRGDAMKRLAQAEENLVRLRDILAELESRIGPLKAQSEKAQKFLVLAGEKKNLEIGLWLNTIEKSKTDLKEQEDKIALASAQYEQTQSSLANLENDMDELIARAQEITLEIEQVRQKAANLEEEAIQIEGGIAVEENTVEHNKRNIERITKDMEQAAGTGQHLDGQINEALGEIERLLENINNKRLELATAAEDMAALRLGNTQFAGKYAEISKRTAELAAKASDKRIETSTAASSKEEILARIAAVDEAAAAREASLEELANERTTIAARLKICSEKAAGLANAVSGYALRVQNRDEKAEKLKKAIDALNFDIHQKNARVKMLEDLEKNMEGFSGSVRAVMRESKRGTLRGIHGPVSQLVTVDRQYEAAIETALGAALQHIVTEDENDAKRAIHYLKESREGRATFLPISAIHAREATEKGLERYAGYIDMADRLLSFDAKYEAIIKSLLARTAVADNLDNAIAIAKQYGYRLRVVTLDGQVVNAGGSMTGGSRGQNAGILGRANEIEQLKETVRELQKKFDGMQADYKTAAADLAAAEAELDGAQADLAREQEEKIRKEGELKLAEGRLETASASIEELQAEKEAALKRIAGLDETLRTLKTETDTLDTDIASLQRQLDSLNDEKETLESRREEIAQKEAGINLEILAFQKDMEAREEAVGLLRRRKAAHDGKVGDLNGEIAAIASGILETKEKIARMNERAAALRAQSAAAKSTVNELVSKRSEFEAKSSALRQDERGMNDDKEKLGGELARLEERKAGIEKGLEEAQNKLFDEYGLTRREAQELNIVLEEPAKAQRRLNEIRNKIRALGSVNVDAIEEYKDVSERYVFLGGQIEDIENSRDELNILIKDLTEKMSERFREQFNKVNKHFGETFAELFDGGKAELILEDPHDILECGIEINVQPPGKNVRNLDLLSGGEKGLAAIALLFAILKVTPAPFCIFDEVDSALDDVNVNRYARYVRRMTKNTQFILITHRRGTMEEADVLYGVTMQEEGVSKLLELRTTEIAKKLGIA